MKKNIYKLLFIVIVCTITISVKAINTNLTGTLSCVPGGDNICSVISDADGNMIYSYGTLIYSGD
ncbi:MAG: hypothetical protein V4663_02445 [Bacteroidota bacterium]